MIPSMYAWRQVISVTMHHRETKFGVTYPAVAFPRICAKAFETANKYGVVRAASEIERMINEYEKPRDAEGNDARYRCEAV